MDDPEIDQNWFKILSHEFEKEFSKALQHLDRISIIYKEQLKISERIRKQDNEINDLKQENLELRAELNKANKKLLNQNREFSYFQQKRVSDNLKNMNNENANDGNLQIENCKKQHTNKSNSNVISILAFNPIKSGLNEEQSGDANPSKSINSRLKIKIPANNECLCFETPESHQPNFLQPFSPHSSKSNRRDTFHEKYDDLISEADIE